MDLDRNGRLKSFTHRYSALFTILIRKIVTFFQLTYKGLCDGPIPRPGKPTIHLKESLAVSEFILVLNRLDV
jgi:hypothetical protein